MLPESPCYAAMGNDPTAYLAANHLQSRFGREMRTFIPTLDEIRPNEFVLFTPLETPRFPRGFITGKYLCTSKNALAKMYQHNLVPKCFEGHPHLIAVRKLTYPLGMNAHTLEKFHHALQELDKQCLRKCYRALGNKMPTVVAERDHKAVEGQGLPRA